MKSVRQLLLGGRLLRPPIVNDPALAAGVRRHRGGLGQSPGVVGHAVRGRCPLRNEVVAVRNDALQRMAGRQQLRLGFGRGHGLDHGVHGGVFHARKVARVLGVCRLAAEQVGKFLARVVRALEGHGGDVEVKLLQALLVQRKVHRAKAQRDAQLFEAAHPGRDGAHAARVATASAGISWRP